MKKRILFAAFDLLLVLLCALETGFLPWLWGAGEAPALQADPVLTPTLVSGGSGLLAYAPEGVARFVALLGACVWGKCLAGFAWQRWGPKA